MMLKSHQLSILLFLFITLGTSACTRITTLTKNPTSTGSSPSGASVITSITPGPNSTPPAPLPSGTASLQLNWATVTGEQDGIYIEASIDGTNYTQVQSLPADAITTTLTGLKEKTLYYMRIRSFNGAGNSPYTAVLSTTTN